VGPVFPPPPPFLPWMHDVNQSRAFFRSPGPNSARGSLFSLVFLWSVANLPPRRAFPFLPFPLLPGLYPKSCLFFFSLFPPSFDQGQHEIPAPRPLPFLLTTPGLDTFRWTRAPPPPPRFPSPIIGGVLRYTSPSQTVKSNVKTCLKFRTRDRSTSPSFFFP